MEASAAYVGEKFGKCLLALLLGSRDVVFGTTDSDVVMEGRILDLLQGVSLC